MLFLLKNTPYLGRSAIGLIGYHLAQIPALQGLQLFLHRIVIIAQHRILKHGMYPRFCLPAKSSLIPRIIIPGKYFNILFNLPIKNIGTGTLIICLFQHNPIFQYFLPALHNQQITEPQDNAHTQDGQEHGFSLMHGTSPLSCGSKRLSPLPDGSQTAGCPGAGK